LEIKKDEEEEEEYEYNDNKKRREKKIDEVYLWYTQASIHYVHRCETKIHHTIIQMRKTIQERNFG